MQFFTLLKVVAFASVVTADGDLCTVDHSGPKQRCSIQFKHDTRSMDKFDEVTDQLKKMECSWIGEEDLRFHKSSSHIAANLPTGFVDTVLAKMPQYQPYIASKSCD